MGVKASDGLDDAFVPDTKAIFIEVILYFFFFLPSLPSKKKKKFISQRGRVLFFFQKGKKEKVHAIQKRDVSFSRIKYIRNILDIGRDVKLFIGAKQPSLWARYKAIMFRSECVKWLKLFP